MPLPVIGPHARTTFRPVVVPMMHAYSNVAIEGERRTPPKRTAALFATFASYVRYSVVEVDVFDLQNRPFPRGACRCPVITA